MEAIKARLYSAVASVTTGRSDASESPPNHEYFQRGPSFGQPQPQPSTIMDHSRNRELAEPGVTYERSPGTTEGGREAGTGSSTRSHPIDTRNPQVSAPPVSRSEEIERRRHDVDPAVRERRALEDAHEVALKRLAALSQELGDVREKARRREVELHGELARTQHAARHREHELTTALTHAEERLGTVTTDLATLRSLMANDNGDAEALVRLFGDINDAISDLAFQLVSELPLGEQTLSASHLAMIKAQCPDDYKFARSFLKYSADQGCQVADVALHLCQALFHAVLQSMVFNRFTPMLDDNVNGALLFIEAHVQAHESQNLSARWRAITHKAVSSSQNTQDQNVLLVNQIFTRLSPLIRVLASNAPDFDSIVALRALHPEAMKIADMAIKLSNQARSMHLSYDYSTYLPYPGGDFKEEEMRREDLPEGSRTGERQALDLRLVVLPVSMGLKATRTEAVPSGELVRATTILKQAHVL